MLTKFNRNPYESFYDYLVKLCYVNSCASNTLFKPIIISNNLVKHFLPDLLFLYKGKLNISDLNSLIEEKVLHQIKEDVKSLLGPFSKFLSHNLIFLFDRFFKYCPKCLEEGNHYLFHQFTFLDQCLIHNIPLIEKCHVCNQRKFSTFSFNKNGYYVCPECDIDLFRHYIKYSPVELVAKSYRNKPILLNLPNIPDKSCVIIDINPSQLKIKKILPNSGIEFIKTYLLYGETSRAVTICVPKIKKFTKFEMSNLHNYYFDCNSINLAKDYTKNDLSILSSIEDIISKVDCRIKNSFRVGYHCENINRTNINYKTKLNNIFVECVYGYKKIKKEQYAYYLWICSCILRNRAGGCNASFLLSLYENLIQLCYNFFNDTKGTVISADVFQLASKIIEFYLYEYFCKLLGLIESNIRNGNYIKMLTEDLLDYGISVGPAYKSIIVERELFYDVYFFEEESQSNREQGSNKENIETMVGGYELIKCHNMSIK